MSKKNGYEKVDAVKSNVSESNPGGSQCSLKDATTTGCAIEDASKKDQTYLRYILARLKPLIMAFVASIMASIVGAAPKYLNHIPIAEFHFFQIRVYIAVFIFYSFR